MSRGDFVRLIYLRTMAQDSRTEKLWKILDTQKEGQLNVKALQRGLSKMDHRKHSILNLVQ